MTLVPLTACGLALGVDPKTLRLWLQAAHLSSCLHPGDARLKCLTLPQLQQLAQLHGRPLPSALLEPVARPACTPGSEQGNPDKEWHGLLEVARPACAPASEQGQAPLTPQPDEAEVRQRLSLLQQQVNTLQAQVTELALLLLRTSCAHGCPPATDALPAQAKVEAPRAVAAEPARPRARSRALPLIQVRADGSVVAIAPNEGVLSLVPDSPAWFAWLSSLTAFSFEGPQGRFSATRKFRQGQRVQSWNVHGSLHGRSCTLYLGLTPTLTLARLQETALAVHTRLTAL